MIAQADLKAMAREKLRDAQALFRAGRYDGSIYLSGYAMELILKARICQTLRWPGFPETKGEFENYQSFRTHNLEVLLHLSGIEDRIKQHYLSAWSVVSGWKPEIRYQRAGTATSSQAQAILESVRILIEKTMNEFITKLKAMERELSEENGAFALFALFQREDSPHHWDLVIAAPWLSSTLSINEHNRGSRSSVRP
jgi:hypothetical protein